VGIATGVGLAGGPEGDYGSTVRPRHTRLLPHKKRSQRRRPRPSRPMLVPRARLGRARRPMGGHLQGRCLEVLRISQFMVRRPEIESFIMTLRRLCRRLRLGVPDPKMNEAGARRLRHLQAATGPEAEIVGTSGQRSPSYKVAESPPLSRGDEVPRTHGPHCYQARRLISRALPGRDSAEIS